MFPTPKELISVSAFYKLISDPINKSQTRGSAGTFFFANTGDKANVYGFEVEGRYSLVKSTATGNPDLKLAANFTRMWFEQDLFEEFQYNNKTKSGLEGASEFIVNGSLTYSSNKEKELVATLVGNYSSDKVFALGVPEDFENSATLYNSAIVEKGFISLDAVVSKKLTQRISAKLYAKNILNPEIEQTQEVTPMSTGITRTEVVRSYKKGIQMGFGLTIKLN
jgi:outer membrane receptor protein involved in Fe transport